MEHIDEDVGSFGVSSHIFNPSKRKGKQDLFYAGALVVTNEREGMKETLINHNCQKLLIHHPVPEETEL